MAKFEFSDAVTRTFKAPGGRSFLLRLALWSSVLLFVAYALLGKGIIDAYANFLQVAFEIGDSSDEEDIFRLFAEMGGMFAAFVPLMFLTWFVMASAETAFHKHMLFGVDKGMFPLRFGADELKVMATQFCVMFLVFLPYMALVFLLLIFIGAASAGGGGIVALLGIVLFFGMFAGIGFMIFLAIRLWPAAALTVRSGEISVLKAMPISKGHFWPMLGAFLVIYLMGYVAVNIVMSITIFAAFGDLSVFEVFNGVSDEDPSEVFAAVAEVMGNPRVMIPLVIGMMAYVMTYFVWYMCLWGVPNYVVAQDMDDERVFD